MPFGRELGIAGDGFLHLRSGVERIVGDREGGHHLVTHGLDDRAVMLFGGLTHDVDAGRHHFACALVPELLIEPRRADDVGKHDGKFDIFGHREQMDERGGLYTYDLEWQPIP